MKALTIWQPWATLIVYGAKPYESRKWRAHASIVGQRIAIHTGARKPRPAELLDLINRLKNPDHTTGLIEPQAHRLLEQMLDHPDLIMTSAILGTAIMGEPIESDIADSDRIEHQRFAWPMLDVKRFDIPLPAKGSQGFWEWKA